MRLSFAKKGVFFPLLLFDALHKHRLPNQADFHTSPPRIAHVSLSSKTQAHAKAFPYFPSERRNETVAEASTFVIVWVAVVETKT